MRKKRIKKKGYTISITPPNLSDKYIGRLLNYAGFLFLSIHNFSIQSTEAVFDGHFV